MSVFLYHLACSRNIARLAAFVPTGEQHDHHTIFKREVDAIAGAKGDAQFMQAAAQRFYISQIAAGDPFNTPRNDGLPFAISQCIEPPNKGFGSHNLVAHVYFNRR
jgi:hypothetical protein